MKILGTVVNDRMDIIGLTMQGKAHEFGQLGDDVYVQNVAIQEILSRRFVNNQIDCSKGNIKTLGDFRLRDLPMMMAGSDGSFKPVDNTIDLVARLLVDGKLAGFEVNVLGMSKKLRTDDVIRLTNWFKPRHFMIATRLDETTKTYRPYITGKAGYAIGNLPERELGTGKTANKKSKTKTIQSADNRGKAVKNPDFDIVELFDIVSELNGYIVKLPGETYKRTKKADKVTGKDFISLGVGEVASAKIDYSEKSMNVNVRFRNIGNVPIEFNGKTIPMPTYTVKTKSIFVNGENHIKRFGIVVGKAQVDALKKKFGASLALEEVNDDRLVTPIRSMYGDPTLQMFIVDTDNLDIISKRRIKDYMGYGAHSIYEDQLKLINYKTILRYINGVKKSAKNAMAETGIKDPRPMYGMYAGFSQVLLDKLTEAGIDVFTGIYTKQEETSEVADDAAATINKAVKTGEYKVEASKDFGVEFGVKGLKTIPSAKDIAEQNKPALKYTSKELLDIIKKVNSFKKVSDMFEYADKTARDYEAKKDEIIKRLWLYKMARLSAGDYKVFMLEDRRDWEAGKASKASNVIDLVCAVKNIENLTLKLTNLTPAYEEGN